MRTIKSLAEILKISDDTTFMQELVDWADWEPAWSLPVLRSRPVEYQLVTCLNALHLCISADGIDKFLREPETGGLVDECRGYCQIIGAALMLEYLAKVAAYFPDRVVPLDDHERWDACADLETREDCLGFRKEDGRYRVPAANELVACLRRYIAANTPRFEAGMRKLGANGPS